MTTCQVLAMKLIMIPKSSQMRERTPLASMAFDFFKKEDKESHIGINTSKEYTSYGNVKSYEELSVKMEEYIVLYSLV